jgi:hypothetical protein
MEFVTTLGIIQGEDGNLNPARNVTRVEMAIMVFRMVNGENAPIGADSTWAGAGWSPFTDIADVSWAHGAINWARTTGVINGTSPTTFNPRGNVTYEQAVAMILRAMNISIPGANFTQNVALLVNQMFLNNRLNMAPSTPMQRQQVAQLIDNIFFADAARIPAGAIPLPQLMSLAVISGQLVSNRYASVLLNMNDPFIRATERNVGDAGTGLFVAPAIPTMQGAVQPAGQSLIANPRISGVAPGAGGVGTFQGITEGVYVLGQDPRVDSPTPAVRIPADSQLWHMGADVTVIVRTVGNFAGVHRATNIAEVVGKIRLTEGVNRIFVNNGASGILAGSWNNNANRRAAFYFHNYALRAPVDHVAPTVDAAGNVTNAGTLGTLFNSGINTNILQQKAGDFTIYVGNLNNTLSGGAGWLDFAFQVTRTYGRATVTPGAATRIQIAGTTFNAQTTDIGGLTDAGNANLVNGQPVITFPLASLSTFSWYAMLPTVVNGQIRGAAAGDATGHDAWVSIEGAAAANIPLSQIFNAGNTGLGHTDVAFAVPITNAQVRANSAAMVSEHDDSRAARRTEFADHVFSLISATRDVEIVLDWIPLDGLDFTHNNSRRIVEVGINRDAGNYFVMSYAWTTIIPFQHPVGGWVTLSGGNGRGEARNINSITFTEAGGTTRILTSAGADNLDDFDFNAEFDLMYRPHNGDTQASADNSYVFGTYVVRGDNSLDLNIMYASADGAITNNANIANNLRNYAANASVVRPHGVGYGQLPGSVVTGQNLSLGADSSFFVRTGTAFDAWRWQAGSFGSGIGNNAWADNTPWVAGDGAANNVAVRNSMALVVGGHALAVAFPRAGTTAGGTGMVLSRQVRHNGIGWHGEVRVVQPNGEIVTLTMGTNATFNRAAPNGGALTSGLLNANANMLFISAGDFIEWTLNADGIVVAMNLAEINHVTGSYNWGDASKNDTYTSAYVLDVFPGNQMHLATPDNQTMAALLTLPNTARIIWINHLNTVVLSDELVTEGTLRQIRDINMGEGRIASGTAALDAQFQVVIYKDNDNAGPITVFAFTAPRGTVLNDAAYSSLLLATAEYSNVPAGAGNNQARLDALVKIGPILDSMKDMYLPNTTAIWLALDAAHIAIGNAWGSGGVDGDVVAVTGLISAATDLIRDEGTNPGNRT